MTFPTTSTRTYTDEQRESLERVILALGVTHDVRELIEYVATERLRTLEALAGGDATDLAHVRNQGRAEGLGWLIGLFNKRDDEER